jgi:hypothetical protein
MTRKYFIESDFNGIENVGEAPEEPGLYVWYSKLKLGRADWDDTGPSTHGNGKRFFLKALKEHVGKHHSLPLNVEAKTIFSMTWSGQLDPEEPRWLAELDKTDSEAVVDDAASSNTNRGVLYDLLGTAAPLFTAPLYIGIAVDQTLRSRLSNHQSLYMSEWRQMESDSSYPDRIDAPGNFAERAIKCGFTPSDLHYKTITFTKEISQQLILKDRIRILKAAEHILNRTSKPVLGRK